MRNGEYFVIITSSSASSSESLLSNMQLGDSFDRLSDAELANAINAVFLEPTKHYQPRYAVPTDLNSWT